MIEKKYNKAETVIFQVQIYPSGIICWDKTSAHGLGTKKYF